jgi:hypothetical protein
MPPIHRGVDGHSSDPEDCASDYLSIRWVVGATTTGALVQNMPMPPGLDGV